MTFLIFEIQVESGDYEQGIVARSLFASIIYCRGILKRLRTTVFPQIGRLTEGRLACAVSPHGYGRHQAEPGTAAVLQDNRVQEQAEEVVSAAYARQRSMRIR